MEATSTSKNLNNELPEVRAAFTMRGSSVAAWAKSKGYSPQYIYDVLRGHRHGPAALKIKRKIKAYLEI